MFSLAPTLYRSPFSLVDSLFERSTDMTASYATDIIDAGDKVVLEIELPGYHKEDIDVSLKTKYLTITAKPTEAKEGEVEKKYISRERRLAEFSRTYTVKNIDESGITASYENGILSVTLPKLQPAEPEERKFTVL